MSIKKKIKMPELNSGKIISAPNEITITHYGHPIFCFKYLHKSYCLDQCTADEKVALIEQLAKLSTMTWKDIQLSPRHGLGSEKISRDSIKPSVPSAITQDVQDFLAFRFDGKKPFVGYRNKFVLHIVYIDRDFTLYNH